MLAPSPLAASIPFDLLGPWLRALYILVASTSQPGILTLPYALASLGWAGGVLVLLATGAYTMFANLLLAQLHHYKGRRHIHYRALAKEIMGGLGLVGMKGWVG